MKSERRHQLQENALARGLGSLPEFSRRYGSYLMLGVIAVLLLILIIQWRTGNAREAAIESGTALTQARTYIERIRNAPAMVGTGRVESLAGFVDQLASAANLEIDRALANSPDRETLAQAHLLRGDLSWELASLPDIPGAATRPSLALEKSDEQYLRAAAEAYETVLSEFSSQPLAVTAARLGLAAIAENRAEWDQARTQYQAILDDPAAGQPFKQHARERLEELEKLRQPPLLATTQTAEPEESDPILGPPVPQPQAQQEPPSPADGEAAPTEPPVEQPAPQPPAPAETPVE